MRRPALLPLVLLGAAAIAVACAAGCSGPEKHGQPQSAKTREITLIFTTELQGTVEPCGCTSDPLGDLARTAALVRRLAGERPTLLLDGGSTLYTENPPTQLRAREEAEKAAVLAGVLPELGLAAQGLGPYDLVRGLDGVRLPRMAANVETKESLPFLAPSRVIDAGGIKVGVFGVVDPALVASLGVTASDPVAAAKNEIAALKKDGADVVVALAHLPMKGARKLAQDAPGADLVLVGAQVPEKGVSAPEQVGGSWLITPGNKGQVLARLDLTVDGPGPLVDAVGPARAATRREAIAGELAQLDAKLAKWAGDASADKAFVAQKQAERQALADESAALEKTPLRKPAKGSYFTFELVAIKKKLACDAAVVAKKTALDRAVGEANRAAAASEPPVPVPPGAATYVGMEECSYCHKPAVEMWKATRHAAAFATLEKVGKEWSRDCVACHVTGWREPGGATLAKTEGLKDVQCEVCHGPGSIHIAADGKEKPRSLVRAPLAERCANACHTKEHSDTFAYEAYLRDVTGPGHGETFRKALGDGPTGHELRSAALAKAGAEIGAGCSK